MLAERKPIPFDEFLTNAPAIFEELEREHRGVLVERAGKLYLHQPRATAGRKRRRGFTKDDSLFTVVGIGASAEPTDISRHKDDYVAEAYGAEPQ